MNDKNFFYYMRKYLGTVLMIGMGLMLSISPASATAMMVQLVGTFLILAAIFMGISLAFRSHNMGMRIAAIVIFALSGIFMVVRPIALVTWFGRLVGILLIIQGIQNLLALRYSLGSMVLPILTIIAGVVLVCLPLGTSRVVLRLVGFAVVVIASLTLAFRLKDEGNDSDHGNPNIIDAL